MRTRQAGVGYVPVSRERPDQLGKLGSGGTNNRAGGTGGLASRLLPLKRIFD